MPLRCSLKMVSRLIMKICETLILHLWFGPRGKSALVGTSELFLMLIHTMHVRELVPIGPNRKDSTITSLDMAAA